MNYKISTYVLLTVLAAILIDACSGSGKEEDSATTSAQVEGKPTPSTRFSFLELTPALADSLKGKPMNRQSGALVSPRNARQDLKRLQDSIGIHCEPSDPRTIYGFTFGMEKFKAFADQVAQLDKESGNKLMGVRVFMALKYKKMKNDDQIYNDVFLVPLDEQGNDLYDIDNCKVKDLDVMNDGTVLNTSVPCPNRCD